MTYPSQQTTILFLTLIFNNSELCSDRGSVGRRRGDLCGLGVGASKIKELDVAILGNRGRGVVIERSEQGVMSIYIHTT